MDFHDAKTVSEALRKLCTDTALVTRLRDGGLARARQFTFEKLATERITAIRQLVLNRGPRP
jgi:ketosteroid isomerase-like protein